MWSDESKPRTRGERDLRRETHGVGAAVAATHPLLYELSEAQRLLKHARTPRATAAIQSAHDDILAELVCDLADAQKLRQLAETDKAKSLLDAVIKSLESALPAISALPTPLLLDPALDPHEWPEAPLIDEPGCWRPPTHALRTVPRCDAGSEEARRLLLAKRPVVLTSSASTESPAPLRTRKETAEHVRVSRLWARL